MDKYEYLTGEDLDYKPSVVDQAKFDYSSLSKFFNKGLKEKDKKERLLKRLKDIEDKSEEQLKAIKSKNEVRIIQKDIDYRKLKVTGGNKNMYDFSDYKIFKELFKDLYYRNMTIDEAERKQDEFDALSGALSEYSPRDKKNILRQKISF